MTLFEHEPAAAPAPGGRILVVEADGGSRGNPGHAGYGALVRDPDTGRIIAEEAQYVGIASNNVAEYSGLVAGLRMAHAIDPGCWILVKMDSKLVVEQMSGRWKIKHEDMRRLAQQARSMVDPQRVKYEWIPREKNKDADRLSNEAMDAGIAGVPWQPRKGSPGPVGSGSAGGSTPDGGDTASLAGSAVPAQREDVPAAPAPAAPAPTGRLHHVEVWVRDLAAAEKSLGWLLERLGFTPGDTWATGRRWNGAGGYIVLEAGPDVVDAAHDRRRPGVNHLAFTAGTRHEVDLLARRAASHGWTQLFADRYPHAGGPEHYAAYLENADGFEVELVAAD